MRTIILVVIIFIHGSLFAQETHSICSKVKSNRLERGVSENNKPERRKISHGFFYAFTNHYTKVDGRSVMTVGNRFGYNLDQIIMIGAGGHLFLTDLRYRDFVDDMDAFLHGGYAGAYVEPAIFSRKVVHLTFPVLIGGGIMKYTDKGFFNDFEFFDIDDGDKIDSDVFFIIEPAVNLEINLTSFMRLGIEGKYRYAGGLELMNTKDDILNNGAIGMNLKIGKF